jgi:hypothetical protein
LSAVQPQVRIPVGVVVERRKATSPWLDVVWRPVAVLGGVPDAVAWTELAGTEEATMFYVGAADIELYRTEAEHYLGNLATGTPSVWVALRRTGAEPPLSLFAVTADPAEGESFTQAGDDLVDAVPMPATVRQIVEAFVAEHHVRQPVYKRQRDGGGRDAPIRHAPERKDRSA